MASLFISHASLDDALVRDLSSWLTEAGFDDFFIDHSDIRTGDRWTDALRKAKGACRVVLCVVTPAWLASDECFGEFLAAWYQGKRILAVQSIGSTPLDERQRQRLSRVLKEDQAFDLTPAIVDGAIDPARLAAIAGPLEAGLRAGGALAKIGVSPYAFEIDRARRATPFPGLHSFDDEDADAAIFFGRSPEIARCLEDLREMRATGARQPYAILGASGAGKSSLMKAGVLPRLRRERGWIALRVFRPGSDPLLAFASAVARSLDEAGAPTAPGAVRDRLFEAWRAVATDGAALDDRALSTLLAMLDPFCGQLRARSGKANATLLVTLDQAEELIRARGESADALCDYLRAIVHAPAATNADDDSIARLVVAFTVRTDSFPELQRAARFFGLDARCADIRPVPVHRFAEIIEEPARRYGVDVEPGLVEAMIDDTPGEDALPLMAFALERLWKQYQTEGHLRRANYDSVGKVGGLIEDAAERALRGLPADDESPLSPNVAADVDDLGARTFIPPLAQLSEGGAAIRRAAPIARFTAKALEMLDHFVAWRLLVRKQDPATGAGTIEIAHESIFRSWPRLQRWIEPERERLQALSDLQVSARVWQQHGRAGAYVDHRGRRLDQARSLLKHEDFCHELHDLERSYLNAAEVAQRRGRILTTTGVAALATVAVVTGGVVNVIAMRAAFRSAAIVQVRQGQPIPGAAYGIAAAGTSTDLTRVIRDPAADDVLWETGIPLKVLLDTRVINSGAEYHLSDDGTRLVTTSTVDSGAIWNVDTARPIATFDENEALESLLSSKTGRVLIRSSGQEISLWDLATGRRIASVPDPIDQNITLRSLIAEDGRRLAILNETAACTLLDLDSGATIKDIGAAGETIDCQINPHLPRLVSRSHAKHCALWDTASGAKVRDLAGAAEFDNCKFGSLTSTIGAWSFARPNELAVFDGITGQSRPSLHDQDRILNWSFTDDGGRAVTRVLGNRLTLWDLASGKAIASLGVADADHYTLSQSGASVIVLGRDDSGVLRRTSNGEILHSFEPGRLKSYRFSAHGERVAILASDHSATLWNAATGVKIADVAPPGGAEEFVFRDDGLRLAVGARGTMGSLWDAESGHKLTDFTRPGEETGGGNFSSKAPRYASSSEDNFGGLWNADTGKFLAGVLGTGSNYDVTLASDGKRLAVQTTQYVVLVFDVEAPATDLSGAALRARACTLNRDEVGVFPRALRTGANPDAGVAHYLVGRPWNPCDWQGLGSLQGWKQEFRHWAVRLGVASDYRCAEKPDGTLDPNAAANCAMADPPTEVPKAAAPKRSK